MREYFTKHGFQVLPVDREEMSSSDKLQELLTGPIHGWVHCAGGFLWKPTMETTTEDFHQMMDANFYSAFRVLQILLPKWRKQNFGRAVWIGSRALTQPQVGMSAYAASKAALKALLQTVSLETETQNISFHLLSPSILNTPANRAAMPQNSPEQWIHPRVLAETARMLIEPSHPFVRGNEIVF
jgi:NAD(P)-dependent dehydrogenase (short-subunit alcohol dehydrogenase family)